jgi:hypothetical protein
MMDDVIPMSEQRGEQTQQNGEHMQYAQKWEISVNTNRKDGE